MKRTLSPVSFLAFLIISVLLVFLANSAQTSRQVPLTATNGIIDLSTWDFHQNGLVPLSGEWACYDGQLLLPDDFFGTGTQTPHLTGYADPTSGRTKNLSLMFASAKGVRTYRLIVKTSPSLVSYGLTIDCTHTASCVYVNGVLLGQSGVPAFPWHGYQSNKQAYSVYFQPKNSQTEIILETANFDYPFPLAQCTLFFGLQNGICSATDLAYAIELCGASVSFLIAFFYVCLYLSSEKKLRFLFAFGEFLGLALSFLTYGDRLIYFFFPGMPFELYAKIHVLCLPIMLISTAAYSNAVNKTVLPLWFLRSVYIPTIAFCSIVLLTPYAVYIYLTGMFDLFLVIQLLCYLWMQLRLYQLISDPTRKTGILLSGFCIAALTIHVSNNFLYDFNWIASRDVGFAAICVFYLLSIASMAMRFVVSLSRTVQDELAFLQAQIRPHFIYNTINTIISFCQTDSERAADLLANFSKYLRMTFDADGRPQTIPLQREIDIVQAYVKIEQARFGSRIRIEYDIDAEFMALQVPPLIIQPLVENAIRHGLLQREDGGLISVSVKRLGCGFTITVKDTGVGMTEKQLSCLRIWQHANGGVGITNLCRRVSHWKNASVEFNSLKNVGTTVTITFKPRTNRLQKWRLLSESHCNRRRTAKP